MDCSPQAPDGWSHLGWHADHLDLCSKGWQNTLLARGIKPMLKEFAFDGWQADTLGPPNGVRYDGNGDVRDPGTCLSAFTSMA